MIKQAPACAEQTQLFHGQQWKFFTGKSELSGNSIICVGKTDGPEVPTAFTE